MPLLEGRRRQVFCVTNKTLNPIKYTVFWGDKQGRNYQIEAGSSIIHSSRFSGPPAVEFAQSDGPIQHVRDRGLNAPFSSGAAFVHPNYSFEYLDADIARVSDYDRFGLYPDAPPAPSPPLGPTGIPEIRSIRRLTNCEAAISLTHALELAGVEWLAVRGLCDRWRR